MAIFYLFSLAGPFYFHSLSALTYSFFTVSVHMYFFSLLILLVQLDQDLLTNVQDRVLSIKTRSMHVTKKKTCVSEASDSQTCAIASQCIIPSSAFSCNPSKSSLWIELVIYAACGNAEIKTEDLYRGMIA